MRSGIDTKRKTGHDREARIGKRMRKRPCRRPSLWRCVTTADDRERRTIQQPTIAEIEHHGRRMTEVEQRAWIVGIVPRDQVMRGIVEPANGCLELVRGHGCPYGGCNLGRDELRQPRGRRIEDGLRVTQLTQQRNQRALRQPLVCKRCPGERARIERQGVRT